MAEDKVKAAEFFAKAEKLYLAACDKQNSASCTKLGKLYQLGPDMHGQPEKAAEAFRKSCNLAQSEGCIELARMYDGGTDIRADHEKALQLYGKSCNILKDGGGCFYLALMYSGGNLDVPGDKAKDAEFSRRSCDLDDPDGCERLGDAYRRGQGVAKDEKRAHELYSRSCALGSKTGCAALKPKKPQ